MYNFKPDPFITGIIECHNCHMKIKWRYNIHKKELGVYIGSFTDDIAFATKCKDKNNQYRVRCRNCDKVNYFEYDME